MKKNETEQVRSAEKGAAPGFMRKTYMVNIDLSEKIEAIVFQERSTLKDVMFEMQSNYVKAWEKKNDPVPVRKSK